MADAGPADALIDRSDYPLFVVTAADREGTPSGCLAGFVTQCSIEPVRFLVCVSKVNHTFGVVQRTTTVGLHLLGRDQADMASLFGEATGDEIDKFADLKWCTGPGGAPIVARCAAWFVGTIGARIDVGDHQALLVTPTAGGCGPGHGLLTLKTSGPLEPGHPVDDAE
jgi:flavin reductase (DIM6/NTAB) family NADH-FMN oxidoreductase RutF